MIWCPAVAILFAASAPCISASIVADTSPYGAIARDTATGLEWLNLTETVGRSFSDISGRFGAGGEFEGFRYATQAEVAALFVNLSLVANGAVTGDGGATALAAIALLGDTPAPNGTAGIYSSSGTPDVATVFVKFFPRPASSVTKVGGQPMAASASSQFTGSFLVRGEINPEPAAIAVWGGLLAGVALVVRRNRNLLLLGRR
jgi:hypothetical protein